MPDEWRVGFDFGATSNNYALLARIMSLSNHLERIRLSRLARDHFRHSPEWLLSHLDNHYKEEQRFAFICNYSG